MRLVTLFVVGALAWISQGDTYYLNTSATDAKAGVSSTNALWWSAADGTKLGNKADDPVPPENDYVVGDGRQFKMDAKTSSFPCASLAFGVASGDHKGNGHFNHYANKTQVNLGSHVILCAGSFRGVTGNNAQFSYSATKTTVTAPESAPFQFLFRYSNQVWSVDSPMEAAPGTGLLCGYSSELTRPESAWRGKFFFTNDWSAYQGMLTITNRFTREGPSDFGTRAHFAALDLPGRIVMCRDTTFTTVAAEPLRIGQLAFGENCLLELKGGMLGGSPTNASITVTNSLTLAGNLTVALRDWQPLYDGETTNEVTLVTVPDTVALDKTQFMIDDASLAAVAAVPHQLEVVEDADAGVKRLVLRFEPMVRQIAADENTFNQAKNTVPFPNSCTNAEHWSDGRIPHPGAHYLVAKYNSKSMWLRTPQQTDGVDDPNIDFTFPGESLVIGGGCGLTLFGRHFRAKKLVLLDGGDVQNGQKHYPDIHAAVFAPAGDVYLSAYNGNTMTVDGELTGAARIRVGSVGGSTSAPHGSVHFNCANTNFLGTMEVYMRNNTKNATASKYHSLKVNDERNLGGRLAEYDPCALSVHGPWTHLIAAANVSFTTNCNRGVYFYDYPVIDTDAYTVKFTTGVGVWGTLEKTGTGTLELGGTLAFKDGVVTEPMEGSNTLAVTKGTLAVSSAGAVDGLALSFASDTALVLKTDFDDPAFLASGICNVKTATPFVLSGTLTKLPLVVDAGGKVPPRACTVGLVTVSAEAAPAVRALLDEPPRICPGFRQSAILEAADDERHTVTFSVRITPAGTRLIVR